MGAVDDLAQQYSDSGCRLVVGCIPFRITEENGLEILMVSSQSGQNLVLPKGGWEKNESINEAAEREAQEEAGVTGFIAKECIGTWIFYKNKKRWKNNPTGQCMITIFPLEVTKQLNTWPEQHRERQWINANNICFEKCHVAWIRESLQKFIEERVASTLVS